MKQTGTKLAERQAEIKSVLEAIKTQDAAIEEEAGKVEMVAAASSEELPPAALYKKGHATQDARTELTRICAAFTLYRNHQVKAKTKRLVSNCGRG